MEEKRNKGRKGEKNENEERKRRRKNYIEERNMLKDKKTSKMKVKSTKGRKEGRKEGRKI